MSALILRKTLLLFFVLLLPAIVWGQTRPISIASVEVIQADDELCAKIGDQWEPGKLTKRGDFMPDLYKIRKFNRRRKNLRKKGLVTKANKLKKKLRKLKKTATHLSLLCCWHPC